VFPPDKAVPAALVVVVVEPMLATFGAAEPGPQAAASMAKAPRAMRLTTIWLERRCLLSKRALLMSRPFSFVG
jgi:hypothetical protein